MVRRARPWPASRDRPCRRSPATERVRPMPKATPDRGIVGLTASFRDRCRRARLDGHHRRLARLRRAGSTRLPPPTAPPAGRPGGRGGALGAAAWSPPGRFAGQARAVGYPPGRRGQGTPGQRPERVRVPLQPPPFPQPWNGVLPGAGTRRHSRTGARPRSRRRPATACSAAHTTEGKRAPTASRSSFREPSVEALRLSGEPGAPLCSRRIACWNNASARCETSLRPL